LAKAAAQCSAGTFPAEAVQVVVHSTLVLRINIWGDNHYLRVAANHQLQY